MPVVVFLIIATALILSWRQNLNIQRSRDVVESRAIAEQLRQRMEGWIDARTAIMSHMADRLESEGFDADLYRTRARRTTEWFPGFQALNWIDGTGRITITFPNEGNEGALGKNLFKHPGPGVAAAITAASQRRNFVRSPVIDLLQGGKGFAVYRAILHDGQVIGYLNGVFRTDAITDLWLSDPELLEGFWVSLEEEDGRHISVSQQSTSTDQWPDRTETRVRVVDKPWTLVVAPSQARLIMVWKGANSTLLLATGMVLAAGICFLLGQSLFRQRSLRQAELRSRSLLAWATKLHRADSYQQIATVTLDEVRQQCGYENVWALILPKEGDGRWRLVFGIGGQQREGQTLQAEDYPLIENALLRERVEVVEDARESFPIPSSLVEKTGLRTLIQIPMHTVDRCPGAFGTGSFSQEGVRPPVKAEVEYLSAMAIHLSEAISRVRFQEQRQRDAEQRATIERRMLEAQKMESLGMLAGGIAHDFNNLLVAILGNADLAREDHLAGEPVEIFLDQIVEASHRAADLCSQMLAYSGGGHRKLSTIDLNEMVRDMATLLQVSISKNATLEESYAEDISDVRGDVTQLRQVVMNLVTNASDALGDSGGTIRIETGVGYLDQKSVNEISPTKVLPDREYCFFRVTDDGCGMDNETRSRIFDPFFSTKSAGHGLGLAAVHGIVRSHDGALRLESKLGEGTTVTVFLPLSLESGPSAAPTGEPRVESAGEGSTILVIDDESDVRGVARAMLEKAGYEVLEAADGTAGLSIYREQREEIDLLLIDMTMPGLNGAQVLDQARSLDPQVRAVISSGFGEKLASRDLQESGRTGFIAKPYTKVQLLAKIAHALSVPKGSQ